MALYVKDPEVDRLATELAARRKTTKTEVIRVALEQELDRERAKPSLAERSLAFARALRARGNPEQGLPADKDFVDGLYGEP